MKYLGRLIILLGIIFICFGTIILSMYGIYDLVINFETLSRVDVFWDVVLIVLRDIISIIVGIVLIMFGGLLLRD